MHSCDAGWCFDVFVSVCVPYVSVVAALGMREESAAVGLMKMQQLGQEGDGGRVSQLLKLGKSLGEDFTLSLLTEVSCYAQGTTAVYSFPLGSPFQSITPSSVSDWC